VVVLAGHGAEAAHLPEQPLEGLRVAGEIGRQEAAGFLRQVEQDGARLEDRDRPVALGRVVVDQRRDAVVGREILRKSGSNCSPLEMSTGRSR
jgi:hypothetical protein